MEVNTIRKYAYSIPFLCMAIGFIGLVRLHWFALAPSFMCIVYSISNYNHFANCVEEVA